MNLIVSNNNVKKAVTAKYQNCMNYLKNRIESQDDQYLKWTNKNPTYEQSYNIILFTFYQFDITAIKS